MPLTKLRPTYTFPADRLRELQAVIPEAFADGRINWDTLKEALNEFTEDETQEHFGLFWPGKREARRLAALPSKGTLVPQPGAGVDEDSTHNLFIEGDNLEVLKLLQKSYAGRVKLIYIDPPYNTGNDFVYPDDYSEPLEAYLKRTGQVDETGQLLTTNSRASGRFHSNWLNMMYPRLLLARQLLQDDGVIFISIDDNEVTNLKNVLNEVFGEENHIATVVWQKMYSGKADATHFGIFHEYILCYAKFSEITDINLLPRTEEMNSRYENPDNDPRGNWLSNDLTAAGERSGGHYEIASPKGMVFNSPQGKHWLFAQGKMRELLQDNRIWFGREGTAFPRLKRFLSEVQQGRRANTLWLHEEVGHSDQATKELKTIFETDQRLFDTPKPTKLMSRILELATSKNSGDIVLDFFAGSCSMADAILNMNNSDDGNRHFIMVQLPEPTNIKSLSTISEIGRERIRRVIKKIKKENFGKLNLSGNKDLGFKSLKLEPSHFSEWQIFSGRNTSQLSLRFDEAESPLVKGWQPENLLSEILLLQGFPLDSRVSPLNEVKVNHVQKVTSEFVAHPLYVCLDKQIKPETLGRLRLRAEDIFVCLDSALSDESKIQLADKCNLQVI